MIIRRKNTKNLPERPQTEYKKTEEQKPEDIMAQFENVDVTNIEFKERLERRRGDRRRGYRRIDERTLVSRAQEEAQSIKDVATKEGYEKGLQNAVEDLENLKNSLGSFANAKKEIYDNISSDVLELGIEVAKKIIKKEVELSDEVLKGILAEVLDKVNIDEQKITFRVSSADYNVAQTILPELLAKSGIGAKMLIVADENVEKGSCILSAANGVVDANFTTQLKIIQNAFGIYKQ